MKGNAFKQFIERNRRYSEGDVEALKILDTYVEILSTENYSLYGRKYDDGEIWLSVSKTNEDMPTIYVNHNYKGEIKLAEVNWYALGSVTPERAAEFAEQVKEAAEFAKLINELDVRHYFTK